jgi:hypothetical protein
VKQERSLLVWLFREMALFYEMCFAKQRNNVIIPRKNEKKIFIVEATEGRRGDRGL